MTVRVFPREREVIHIDGDFGRRNYPADVLSAGGRQSPPESVGV